MYADDAPKMQSVLDNHPDLFSGVLSVKTADGDAIFVGDVSKAGFDLLNSEMQKLFGESVATRMTWCLRIGP